MRKILVSGLVNNETTCAVRGFPIEYYPIDYSFFGVQTKVSGVGFNLVKAMRTLGLSVDLASMVGDDTAGRLAVEALETLGVSTAHVLRRLQATPASVVLYDPQGSRQIYCDLKDIQETDYAFESLDLSAYALVVACNIQFNRPLLHKAKAVGIPIATDVHVLRDLDDAYNREFMEQADILFLSDEGLPCAPRDFLTQIEERFGNAVIVLGQGSKGALMYVRSEHRFYDFTAAAVDKPIVNTVGAGDALFSAFVSLYAEGLPPAECLKRAELFAAAKIAVSGASEGFISRSEWDALYDAYGVSVEEKA